MHLNVSHDDITEAERLLGIFSGKPQLLEVDGLAWCEPGRIDVAPIMHDGVMLAADLVQLP